MGLATSLDDERLDNLLVEIIYQLGEWLVMGQDNTLWIGTVPMTNIQAWMFSVKCGMPYENSILLCTQLVREHLGLLVANLQSMAMVVDKTIGRLSPLQYNVRTMLGMISEETAIQPLAFLL
jgi:hypothetical protein